MLPTQEEQLIKWDKIVNNEETKYLPQFDKTKEYAKWYAEQVIKHCAEVAETIDNGYTDELPNGELHYFEKLSVDKQSILNVINEL